MVEFDENLNPIEDRPAGGQNNNPPHNPSPQTGNPNPWEPRPQQVHPTPPPAQPAPAMPKPPTPTPTAPDNRPARGGMSAGVITVLVVVLLGVFATAITAIATGRGANGAIDSYTEGITVYGESVVYAAPDIAKLTFGVTANARTVEAVREDIDAKIDRILDALDELDIDDKDIKTTNYNLYPAQDYQTNPPRITGYTGQHDFTLTIRNLDSVNAIVDAVTKAGVNQVSNVIFTVEDEQEWVADARNEAITKAKDQAKAIAKSAGIRLGKLVSIQENVGTPFDGPYYMEGRGGGGVAPDLQAGSQEIRVNVTLRYEIG